MNLTAQETIDASCEAVFATLTDFERIETLARKRRIAVTRQETAEGMAWDATFGFRGKERTAHITLAEHTPPSRVVFNATVSGLDTVTTVDLDAVSESQTRVSVHSSLTATTMGAKLLLQPFKLAKGGIEKRFQGRMASFAESLQDLARQA